MLITQAEARVALGLAASITPADQALLEMLLPLVKGAIQDDPTYGLMYDPEEKTGRVEYYPRIDGAYASSPREGTWDTNLAGTKAYFQDYGRNDILQLKHLPVREINEIKVDYNGGFGQRPDTFGNDTVYIAGEQFHQDLDSSGLNLTGHVFSNTGWPVSPGSIKVTYKSGYTADELRGRADTINASGIWQAALLTLMKSFRTMKANARQGNAGFVAGAVISERLGDYGYSTSGESAASMTGMMVSVPPEAGALLSSFRHFGLMVL